MVRELEVRPGVYRHYKGTYYQVHCIAYDANSDEIAQLARWAQPDGDSTKIPENRIVVMYTPLSLAGKTPGRPVNNVRTIEDFLGWVQLTPEQFDNIIEMNNKVNDQLAEIPIRVPYDDRPAEARRFTYQNVLITETMLR